MNQQQQQPIAAARPAIYVEVVLNGNKTVYDIASARALHEELGNVLTQLDAATVQTTVDIDGTGQVTQSQTPSDPDPEGDDEAPLAAV